MRVRLILSALALALFLMCPARVIPCPECPAPTCCLILMTPQCAVCGGERAITPSRWIVEMFRGPPVLRPGAPTTWGP